MIEQSEIQMESPDERQVKKILVSLWSRTGFVGWRLASARKVGRCYAVSEDATEWGAGRRMVSPLEAYGNNDYTSPVALDNHLVSTSRN